MFQFSGFPILADLSTNGERSLIRLSRVQSPHVTTPSLSQLATTFIGLSNQAVLKEAYFTIRYESSLYLFYL